MNFLSLIDKLAKKAAEDTADTESTSEVSGDQELDEWAAAVEPSTVGSKSVASAQTAHLSAFDVFCKYRQMDSHFQGPDAVIKLATLWAEMSDADRVVSYYCVDYSMLNRY